MTTAVCRPRPTRRAFVLRVAAVAVVLTSSVAGCAGDGGASAAVGTVSLTAPSPELRFPCGLVAAEEVGDFLGEAELTDVDRSGTTAFVTGCTWESVDGTGAALDLHTDVSARVMTQVLEKGAQVDGLAGPGALLESATVLEDRTPGVARDLYGAVGEKRVSLGVRAVDPSVDAMVAVLARVQARMAASSGPAAADGSGLPSADLAVCQQVVAEWGRVHSVLAGTAQVVSSLSKYTDGLVAYAAEKGPGLDDPELAAAYAALAAARPADTSDPTADEVTAVRTAVEDIGAVCAAGGVSIDWLPR